MGKRQIKHLKTKYIANNITLYFHPEDHETANIVESACLRSISIIKETWHLSLSKRCCIYIMTSWIRFIFQFAPWYVRIYYVFYYFSWAEHFRKIWPDIGGWTLNYATRTVIGIKSPRLRDIKDINFNIGKIIFTPESDINKHIQHIVCHEMTHAFCASLKLPMWLNEGIAMITVDKFFEKMTVAKKPLEVMSMFSQKNRIAGYKNLIYMKPEEVAYNYLHGYWITRYLMETQPELLMEILSKKINEWVLYSKLTLSLNISQKNFWQDIDNKVTKYFSY
jgi:hypothetical protein